jgi:hypothetical protein
MTKAKEKRIEKEERATKGEREGDHTSFPGERKGPELNFEDIRPG